MGTQKGLQMEGNAELQELNDEELRVVVGGYKGHHHGSVQQQNNVWTSQHATASGLVATALDISVVIPVNVNINL